LNLNKEFECELSKLWRGVGSLIKLAAQCKLGTKQCD